MFDAIFDSTAWARVPFWFWGVVMFWFGCIVGSFLNVCIYRMPLGMSVVNPPSHCPHCKYAIPFYLNVPLVTWLWLGGKCKNCRAPISPRYFFVELLTGVTFLGCWLRYGDESALLALAFSMFLAALITATFIDFEHYIIPDEITLGGMAAGVLISTLLPSLHGETMITGGMMQSIIGLAAGGGLIYLILRAGKFFFGKQRFALPPNTKIVFTETALHLPDREIPYEELFYRRSDAIVIRAHTVELIDRGYREVRVRLALLARELEIGDERFDSETCQHMEVVTSELILPREAMGLGDVKFMAAIGAFLGWQATIFSLMVSSMIGAAVGITLVAFGKRELSSRLPYGPYIAMAAAIWVFAGKWIMQYYFPATLPGL
ncbi:MAG: prepilin peptidase [Pedosphaera sp.]|nr:prepilin peptidase [Pedosphaera sp.]